MEDIQKQQNMQEKEIDLIELAKKVWSGRKLILKSCGWAVLVGLVVGFSIPKEYTANVTLAPEAAAGRSVSGGLSALAGMAGINLGASQTTDALSPQLYPDIVKSIPFSIEMFDIKVTDTKGKLNTTVYEYLKEHQKQPWWKYITSAPSKALGWVMRTIKGEKENTEVSNSVNSFRLTDEQSVRNKNLSYNARSSDSSNADKRGDGKAAGLYYGVQNKQGKEGSGIYSKAVRRKHAELS